MTARLWEVSPQDLLTRDNVNHLWPWFQQVEADTHSEWSVRDILESINDKTISVFAAVHEGQVLALCGVGMLKLSNGEQIGRFWFCVGHERQRWQHLVQDIFEWLKARGCTRIDGRFRLGWSRLLKRYGLKMTHAVCEMEL